MNGNSFARGSYDSEIVDSLGTPVPKFTRGDVWVPGVAGKAVA